MLTLFLFICMPTVVLALGLGSIKVQSYLNQPLKAEISLHYLNNTPIGSVQAHLATEKAYEEAGLVKPKDIPGLKIVVTRNKRGRPIIELSTKEVITDPVFNFLIEVVWPNGGMFREYAVLLDPPVNRVPVTIWAQKHKKHYSHHAKNSQASESREAINKNLQQQKFAQQQIAVSKIHAITMPLKNYGPIKSGENLRSIAMVVRPTKNVSIDQTMIAIASINPKAFTHGNISALKQGKVLTVPSLQMIQQIPVRQAEQLVAAENQQWQALKSGHRLKQQKILSVLPDIAAKLSAIENVQTEVAKQKIKIEHPHLNPSMNLSLEKNATIQLPSATSSQIYPIQSYPIKNRNKKSKQHKKSIKHELMHIKQTQKLSINNDQLKNKLALSIATTDSIERTQRLIQLRFEDLRKQNHNLQHQLLERDQSLVQLQTHLAQLEHPPLQQHLHDANFFANQHKGLQQGLNQSYQVKFALLNKIPVVDWIILILFLGLVALIVWLLLRLKQTQLLLATSGNQAIGNKNDKDAKQKPHQNSSQNPNQSMLNDHEVAVGPKDGQESAEDKAELLSEQASIQSSQNTSALLQEKIDLAKTYIQMQDYQAAQELLVEVLANGDQEQQKLAQDLLLHIK